MFKIKQHIVDELHKPSRVNFKRRRVLIKGLDDLFQADLVELIPFARENKGYRYILVVIDVFSKYVWVEAVKNKTGEEISKAMRKILNTNNRISKNLQTDMGKEFYNKNFQELMRKNKINHYSTFSSKKASIVERVNRTLKSIMWKEFSFNGNYKWINILPEIVSKYNNKKHNTINMKPINVNKKNELSLLNSVYNNIKIVEKLTPKFKVGDHVRISKNRAEFQKGYTPNWSNEIFTISKIKLTNPITFILVDQANQPIQGGFYTQELQKAKYPNIYLVEKVLKRKGGMVYVKWLGFDSSHNSWIHKNNVE